MDIDKNIDMNDVQPNCRVALRSDSYKLHKILPNKVGVYVSHIHKYFQILVNQPGQQLVSNPGLPHPDFISQPWRKIGARL